MTFSAPNLNSNNDPCNYPAAFAYEPWLDSWYVLGDNMTMPYDRGGGLLDEIPLFALDCADFYSHMCALNAKVQNSKSGHRSAGKRFEH